MVRFPQCPECVHFQYTDDKRYVCAAYPEGIPEDVLWGKISHKEHIEGDHGYIFKQIEENE